MLPLWLCLVPLLLGVSAAAEAPADDLTFDMGVVIGILEDLESHLNKTSDSTMTHTFWEHVLRPETRVPLDLPGLNEKQGAFLERLLNHETNDSLVEHGVVLTPDGTTVSLSPVVAGIAAGLKVRQEGLLPAAPWLTDSSSTKADPLLAPVAQNLGLAFLLFHTKRSPLALGPNGCWDNISAPHTFTLMEPPSHIPDAFINGAMDGLVLGTYLAEKANSPSNASTLLSDYYGGGGLGGDSQLRSNFRRRNFATLVSEGKLREQVETSLQQLRRQKETSSLFKGIGSEELTSLTTEAVEEFMTSYVECPAIIPRCMWGARPYRGAPTQLHLPLGSVYIHHTHSPSQPCLTFPACAADMRAMQRFHQDIRGWDDIGYNFVVGGEGYIYQGRGWHCVGAHTRGHNSEGYGVSFIGDYMTALPASFSLDLVKDNFMRCATKGSRLHSNYSVHGHRQMVTTTLCPGDRLFKEIETWKGFKVRCFLKDGVRHCI